jgi:SM-20-related protein
MTPKQILDSFSDTLMNDERILSARERELLANLLRHAEAAADEHSENPRGVRAVIASAVGETVAQRAFAVLGGSIVQRIVESRPGSSADVRNGHSAEIDARRKDPDPPGLPVRDPEPPGVAVPHHKPAHRKPERPGDPEPPGAPLRDPEPPGRPLRDPEPPGVPLRDPEPPGRARSTAVISETNVVVRPRPATLPAQCVILDEFLAPQELEELTRFALEHETQFSASEVVAPTSERGVIDYEHRRSRVLTDLENYQELLIRRIKMALPQVVRKLEMEEFAIAGVEAQITASNDGDFFHFHSDNASDRVAARHLTFVYFFHREPRRFEGGELRIHDARLEEDRYISAGSYQTIVPRQNQIVFFPCELLHEITAVKCPSRLFADSRFTLNGWLRQ